MFLYLGGIIFPNSSYVRFMGPVGQLHCISIPLVLLKLFHIMLTHIVRVKVTWRFAVVDGIIFVRYRVAGTMA